MDKWRFAGPLLRIFRIQKNWSQETLCHGICAVSYLSKIEQGKAEPNEQLLEDLFSRLGVTWDESPQAFALRDDLYEGIFSLDESAVQRKMEVFDDSWDQIAIGPCYADFLVIRAYHYRKPDWIPKELESILDARQLALVAILQNRDEDAYHLYPCALTAVCVGEEALLNGNYTRSLEYFQLAYDMAAREGYAHLMMFSQHCMAASYSDMGNLDAMYRHSKIAERLGRALGADDVVAVIHYNIAATKVEYGDYDGGYRYFSTLEEPDAMALHKLSVCCEALGKEEEALAAIQKAIEKTELLPSKAAIKKEICELVLYRLEHPDYLHDQTYGELLLRTYEKIENELSSGFKRFHLPWVTQWLTANRQYRKAYEIMKRFPYNSVLDVH